MKFGDRIRIQREANGLTRAELADKIGLNYYTLAKYETSDREPDFDTLIRLADALSVSIDYLLGIPERKLQQALSQDEQHLLQNYRALSSAGKARIQNQLDFEYLQTHKNN